MPNFNPTPKDEYLRDAKQVADHHVLVENEILRRAVKSALDQYERKIASMAVNDLGTGCMNFMRIQGAHELVDTFFNLCETNVAAPVTDRVNLASNKPFNPTVKK